jgi:hypothetical protein
MTEKRDSRYSICEGGRLITPPPSLFMGMSESCLSGVALVSAATGAMTTCATWERCYGIWLKYSVNPDILAATPGNEQSTLYDRRQGKGT